MGGFVGGTVALLLWYYRYLVDHVFNWDLLAVALTIIVVKWSLMLWYRKTD
jgi:hypothetical protein